MVIEGPLAYILVIFLVCFVLGKLAEYLIDRKRKKRNDKQIKLIEERMALIKDKIRLQTLDLQESLTILNKEYAGTLKDYYQKLTPNLDQFTGSKSDEDTSDSETQSPVKKK